jgi:hypothetical protein
MPYSLVVSGSSTVAVIEVPVISSIILTTVSTNSPTSADFLYSALRVPL